MKTDETKKRILGAARETSKKVCVSCWQGDTQEKVEMWKIYGKEKNSVCVHAEMEKLEDVARMYANEHAIGAYADIVEYVPPNIQCPSKVVKALVSNDAAGDMYYYFQKHKMYAFENEWRLAIWKEPDENLEEEKGITLSLSTQEIVSKVVVSPFADDSFIDVVDDVLRRFGHNNIEVERSSLQL
ncbi:MAG: DUF2971 domain-containing protein [Candidatus Omnitrophica bacterium]|nr:DUF2971 domain-containing protein [Candidatus Omnitrophota bacterium]